MLPFDPKKPLFGFTARFPHAKRRIHLFLSDSDPDQYVYFRPKNAPQDWLGVLGDSFLWCAAKDFQEQKEPLHKFLVEVRRALNRKLFFRHFLLPDPRAGEKRMWSVHWRPEVGYVLPVDHPTRLFGAYFRPRNRLSCNLVRVPTKMLKAHFLPEWENPESDVRDAMVMCDLNHDERARYALRCESGNWKASEEQLRLACVCEPALWESAIRGHITIDPTEEHPLYVHPTWNDRGRVQGMLSPRLHRVLQRLCDSCPTFARLGTCRGASSRQWWGYPWQPELPTSMLEPQDIDIHLEPSTQHERLEASLFLRDWLTQNAPDLLGDWFPEQP